MNNTLLDAYSLFNKATPLKNADCGRLCDARCCTRADGDAMELFPGESELFEDMEGFEIISDHGRELLKCSGQCDRSCRPLACRIYPLFPVYDAESEKIKVIYDPRGGACPLYNGEIKLNRLFIRAVRRCGRLLLRDKKCSEYLKETSEYLIDISLLADKLG